MAMRPQAEVTPLVLFFFFPLLSFLGNLANDMQKSYLFI
jgi:hypothetical protein